MYNFIINFLCKQSMTIYPLRGFVMAVAWTTLFVYQKLISSWACLAHSTQSNQQTHTLRTHTPPKLFNITTKKLPHPAGPDTRKQPYRAHTEHTQIWADCTYSWLGQHCTTGSSNHDPHHFTLNPVTSALHGQSGYGSYQWQQWLPGLPRTQALMMG